jgi:hypothetical protein
MRLVAITSASKPSIAINASQRAIRARITPCMARPPEPRRPPADEWFNSVHLWRRNRDRNEGSTGRICDEAPAHRRQHRQAAGVAEAVLTRLRRGRRPRECLSAASRRLGSPAMVTVIGKQAICSRPTQSWPTPHGRKGSVACRRGALDENRDSEPSPQIVLRAKLRVKRWR